MLTTSIPCPICKAPAGAMCRASGRVGTERFEIHVGREFAAQYAAVLARRAAVVL